MFFLKHLYWRGVAALCFALTLWGAGSSEAAPDKSATAFADNGPSPYAQASFHARTSSNIPLNSWIYPALDKLAGLGLIPSAIQGSRPYTRLEAARQTLEAWRTGRRQKAPPVAMSLIRRLVKELHQQMTDLGALDGVSAGSYVKPVGDWALLGANKNGDDARHAPQKAASSTARIDSLQNSLNYNNFGIEYRDGENLQLSLESEARLSRRLLLNVRPVLFAYEDSHANTEETSLQLLEGKVAWGWGPVEFSAGRQSLWWGQGRHGTLILTNNAKPLDMVRVTNPVPLLLPGFLEPFGLFRFDVFLSRLESDRVVPEPYFGGLRAQIKPFPWLELGAARTAMFGGEGRPKVGFSDFLTIVGGENLGRTEDASNSIATIDARLKVPMLWNLELYGEMGGEDQADLLGFIPFISNKAYLGGLYLPRIEPTGRLGLRLEYADLSHIDDNSPLWYRHGIYRSGYTYKNKIMGHHAGGGAEDFFAELEVLLPRQVSLAVSYDFEKRGSDQAVEERHRQSAASLRWDVCPELFLKIAWRHDAVENFEYISGRDENFYLTELAVGGRF